MKIVPRNPAILLWRKIQGTERKRESKGRAFVDKGYTTKGMHDFVRLFKFLIELESFSYDSKSRNISIGICHL